jgi:hypothetical protein
MTNHPEKKNEPQGMPLQVEIDDTLAQGAYANLALIAHSPTEFVFDFIFLQPQQPKAKVRARIISSPAHTKRFLRALAENVSRYEKLFGEIKEQGITPEEANIRLH